MLKKTFKDVLRNGITVNAFVCDWDTYRKKPWRLRSPLFRSVRLPADRLFPEIAGAERTDIQPFE